MRCHTLFQPNAVLFRVARTRNPERIANGFSRLYATAKGRDRAGRIPTMAAAQYKQNHLLAALPKAEFARLGPKIKIVTLPLGKALYEPGTMLRHVYFPTDSIVSLRYVMSDGASAEIAFVGNEGVVGVALFMGGETTPSRAVVQSAGEG